MAWEGVCTHGVEEQGEAMSGQEILIPTVATFLGFRDGGGQELTVQSLLKWFLPGRGQPGLLLPQWPTLPTPVPRQTNNR